MRLKIALLSLLALMLGLTGCDDAEPEETGVAPTLSDLMITSELAATVGETLTIEGMVTVQDPDGDVDQLQVTVNLPDGSSQALPATEVQVPDGATAFSMQVLMVLRPPVAGTYRMDVQVDDATGNLSNALSFDVVAQ